MPNSATPFESYRDKWLEAEPEARFLRVFAPEAGGGAIEALLVLAHEIEQAALASPDTRVAQAKLGWWMQELARCAQGTAQHPLSRRLAESRALGEASTPLLAALARGASAWIELESVASLSQWLDSAADLAVPLEALIGGRSHAPDAAPVLRTTLGAAMLARQLRHFPRWAADSRGLLPLDMLAVARSSRGDLAQQPDGSVAAAVLAAVARGLAAPLEAGRAAFGERVSRLRIEQARLLALGAAQQPARLLAGRLRISPLPSLATLWRAARHTQASSARSGSL